MPVMENVRRISFAYYAEDGLQGGGVRGENVVLGVVVQCFIAP
jgi:hypothetical protein